MLRSIAIYPVLSCEAAIQRIRSRFDSLAKLVPHHATLVFPFESALGTREVQTHMEAALQGMPPFEVSFGSPAEVGDTVQVPLADGALELRHLHAQLYSGILRPFLREDIPFRPHVTIGRALDPGARKACLREAAALVGASGRAEELCCEIIGADESSTMEIVLPMSASRGASLRKVPTMTSALMTLSTGGTSAWIMRGAFVLAAVAMAWQTLQGHRRGFMYCGTTERVYKQDNPSKYRRFVLIQWGFVVLLLLFAATWRSN